MVDICDENLTEEEQQMVSYVNAILERIKDKHPDVQPFNSAIELNGWTEGGYTFLYDFAVAALNVAMTTPILTMQDIIDAGRGLDHTPSEIQP